MDFMGFLLEQGVVIAAALYVLGMFMKKAPFIPDWSIPFILTGLGVAAAVFSMQGGFTVGNALQGVFAAGAAVLAHQMGKQAAARDVGGSPSVTSTLPRTVMGTVNVPAFNVARPVERFVKRNWPLAEVWTEPWP